MELDLILHFNELLEALEEMHKARQVYEEAVEEAHKTAAELANNWEGAARDAFVAHQANAYSWHGRMLNVLLNLLNTIQDAVEEYKQNELEIDKIAQG